MMANANHWKQLAENMGTACKAVVAKVALDGQAHIQQHIQANGQIDTGFLLNSVYAVTSETTTYGQAGTPPGKSSLLPQADGTVDDSHALIAVGASYAVFQNYGTRYLPPRPFFEPGIEETRQELDQALAAIEPQLQGGIS